MASYPIFNVEDLHIEIDYHLTRELHAQGALRVTIHALLVNLVIYLPKVPFQ